MTTPPVSSAAKTPFISILLATYNWPSALALCLQSLRGQTDLDFEILIADDGSREDTRTLLQEVSKDFPVPVKHLWQEDLGFRKSKILNLAIQEALGEYLVFLDGDCIVQPDFVAQHRRLSKRNQMITGSRILLSEQATKTLAPPNLDLVGASAVIDKLFSNELGAEINKPKSNFLMMRLKRQINKVLPLLLKLPNHPFRPYPAHVWKRIKGCNMSCWREDAIKIDGFDESFEGWGHEDADFVFRLEETGVRRISGSYATEVIHLWHRTNPSDQERVNKERVLRRIRRQ